MRLSFKLLLLTIIVVVFLPLGGFGFFAEDLPDVAEHRLFLATGPAIQSNETDIPQGAYAAMSSQSKRVTINDIFLTPGIVAEGDRVLIDIYSGLSYTAIIDRVNMDINGILSLRGRLENDEYGYIIISGSGNKLTATIKSYNTQQEYLLSYDASLEQHYLYELDPQKADILPGTTPVVNTGEITLAEYAPQSLPQVTADVVIDVMTVYTPLAREKAAETDGIDHFISQAMELSQLALDNSEVGITLRLVHTGEVNYRESSSITTDLNRLTSTTRTYMPEVHEWRDAYGADLVNLFIQTEESGGRAWILESTSGEPKKGFSITRVRQASWTYTMIHELAHNFGCHHSKYQTVEKGPGIFSYSAGWRWVGEDKEKYASVMAYGEGIYSIVPYFSNPNVSYKGTPTGDHLHGDNARTLRQNKSVIAGYREIIYKVYTVLFKDYDGNLIMEEKVEHGADAKVPKDPEREGYTFSGWDTDFTNVTDDITVTAEYTINQYTVTFNSVGGSEVPQITQDYGTNLNSPVNPTREGYTFEGWDPVVPATMPASNITLIAQWSIKEHTLTYIAVGNGLIEGSASQTATHGSNGTPVNAIPDPGYQFLEWSDGLETASRKDTNVISDISVTASFIPEDQQKTAPPVLTTTSQTVFTPTLIIEGTAEPGSLLRITYIEEVATGIALNDGVFSVEVTLIKETANTLSVTARTEGKLESNPVIIEITHETEGLSEAIAAVDALFDEDGNILAEVTQDDLDEAILLVLALNNEEEKNFLLTRLAEVSEEFNSPPPQEFIMGDVDGDGQIAVADAILVLRHIVGLIILEEDQLQRAKVNDGVDLTVSDAILILRYLVGLIEDFNGNIQYGLLG